MFQSFNWIIIRGTITGTAHVKLDDVSGECEKDFVASLHDNKGMCVAEVTVTWKLSLKNQSNENKTAVKEKNKWVEPSIKIESF